MVWHSVNSAAYAGCLLRTYQYDSDEEERKERDREQTSCRERERKRNYICERRERGKQENCEREREPGKEREKDDTADIFGREREEKGDGRDTGESFLSFFQQGAQPKVFTS